VDWETIHNTWTRWTLAQRNQLHPISADLISDDLCNGVSMRRRPARRPKTSAREMSRLLAKVGRRIVRIFDPTVSGPTRLRPDFDGSPMVTDIMCDEIS